jgi:RNA polymerase sigma-70 factor (ECF subfamily)
VLHLHPPPPAQPLATDDEFELVERARHDRRAFAPLYQRYAPLVYRYCYHALGGREAAEDATSLVFEKVLARLPDYRHRSFRSWLFAIAHNVIVDHFRAARPVGPLDEALAIPDADRGPEERAIARDEGQRLRAAMAQLSDDQRRVIELRLAGLDDHEIAEVLGRKYATVRTIQRRAVIRLQALLGVTAEPAGEACDADV